VKTAEASNQYGNDPLLSVTDTLTLLGHTEKQKSSWAAGWLRGALHLTRCWLDPSGVTTTRQAGRSSILFPTFASTVTNFNALAMPGGNLQLWQVCLKAGTFRYCNSTQ